MLKPRLLSYMWTAAFGLRLILVLVLALLIGGLAYQAPIRDRLPIGWLGDRLFLNASEGWSSSDSLRFYGDELTPNAASGRSRWTHQGAELRLPGLGRGDASINLSVQGWPADVLHTADQPRIAVFADGQALTEFTPTSDWTIQHLSIPSSMRSSDDLVLTLQSSATFTGTQIYTDPRPKGLRLSELIIETIPPAGLRFPATMALLLLILSGSVCFLALGIASRRQNLSFGLSMLLLLALGLGLVFARIWVVALLPWLLLMLLLMLLWVLRSVPLGYVHRLYWRLEGSTAPGYMLLAIFILGLIIVGVQRFMAAPVSELRLLPGSFPDLVLFGLLGLCLLGLGLVLGQRGLPNLTLRLAEALNGKPGLWLCVLFLASWVISLASINANLPYVGHADYADNAVVARNLALGRGWVVDYVTQFYRLYDGVTRPQETWPLLQPVWIAPFFIIVGVSSWAAKIPNLFFTALLGWMLYRFGAQHWGRRVGLIASLILLTNHLFFKLAIYVTSDLAFVVFAFGALAMLYEWSRDQKVGEGEAGSDAERETGRLWQRWRLLLSAVLTGLMVLQKPGSGGLIALGMGFWLLAQVARGWGAGARQNKQLYSWRVLRERLLPVLLWGTIAGLIIMPLIVRNMRLFEKPYFSTESYDAWILEYTDWDRIYAVYAPELSDSGVPDRSWLLRWGFDRTLQKISNQLKATRDYLMPALPGLPTSLSDLFGRPDKDIRLLFDVGAWLTLLGFARLCLRHSQLPSLLIAAFTPYVLFLIIYWHANEERYFVVLMPWLALLASMMLWRLYARIAGLAHGRWAPVGLLLLLLALYGIISPSWNKIDEKVRYEPQLYAADLDAYSWLKAHTAPDAVMMTRNPWQLNWTAERPAVMIPYTTDRNTLLILAKHYKAQYLVLDSLQRPEPEVRTLIEAMLADQQLGFKEVYRTPIYAAEYGPRRTQVFAEIYAFPEDYGGK